MARALKFSLEALPAIKEAVVVPPEDVESQYANSVTYRNPYYCVLDVREWDGDTIPFVWTPASHFHKHFKFVGPESNTEFVEVVSTH
jgi:hypothetical protein